MLIHLFFENLDYEGQASLSSLISYVDNIMDNCIHEPMSSLN